MRGKYSYQEPFVAHHSSVVPCKADAISATVHASRFFALQRLQATPLLSESCFCVRLMSARRVVNKRIPGKVASLVLYLDATHHKQSNEHCEDADPSQKCSDGRSTSPE
eukprot:TRINITY_DN8174_c0_g2_i1.p3 TRINITY_DN8174_c0_g2~~TRINITY_DN8174_c0_g2_i1.p3  ORF type:complete len:109 (-),score=11.98 TRINITY_DN8174_c0_g2_i1:150-476(-)